MTRIYLFQFLTLSKKWARFTACVLVQCVVNPRPLVVEIIRVKSEPTTRMEWTWPTVFWPTTPGPWRLLFRTAACPIIQAEGGRGLRANLLIWLQVCIAAYFTPCCSLRNGKVEWKTGRFCVVSGRRGFHFGNFWSHYSLMVKHMISGGCVSGSGKGSADGEKRHKRGGDTVFENSQQRAPSVGEDNWEAGSC